MLRNHLILAIIALLSFPSLGSEFVIESLESQFEVQAYFDAYIDHGEKKTLSDILKATDAEKSGATNFGFSDDIFWLKTDFVSHCDKVEEWFFEVDYPHLDTIDFYLFKEGQQVIHLKMGDDYAFGMREIDFTGFVFPVDIVPNKKYTAIFRIHSTSDIEIPIHLHKAHDFENKKFPIYLLFGFYYGVLAVMFLYNLIISLTLKDDNYKYYALSIVSTLFFMIAYNGHGYEFIWPNSPVWNEKSVGVFLSLTAIFVVLITQKFLNLSTYHKILNKIFQGFLVINLILLAYSLFIPGKSNHEVILGLIGIQIPTSIVAGVLAWRKGNEAAKYFTLAWIIYQVGGSLAIGKSMGIYDSNFLTNNAVYFGSVLEIVLLSFALSYRYGRIKKERKEAQKEIIEMQKRANEELEQKVEERTSELNEANTALRTIITELDKQKQLVDEKNRHITDSIRYAETIQVAILPNKKLFSEHFKDHFVVYRPKDVVSGDFYWIGQVESKIILAAIDCTGHGVPGAMLTMAAANILENIIHQNLVTDPAAILTKLDKSVKSTLAEHEGSNAMDLSVVTIDKSENSFKFAGAYGDIYCRTKEGFEELRGTKKLIGSDDYNHKTFESTERPLDSVLEFYMYSDGFKDQFGEGTNKKFMKSQFFEIIRTNINAGFSDQGDVLLQRFDQWKGSLPQTDDILVLGLKLN